MKRITKVLFSFAKMNILFFSSFLLVLVSLGFYSCQKSGSFDSYYYLTKPLGNADPVPTATINIDGTNQGAIQYIASPVTAQSQGINHVKLPYGRHTYTVYDASNKAIISGYIEDNANEVGSGSWGAAGGGDSCTGGIGNAMLVGLFR